MALTEGILLGLTAAASWGTADFFAQKAVRKIGALQTFFGLALSSLLPLLAAAMFFWKPLPQSPWPWALLFFASALSTAAFLAYYQGLKTGKLAVVSSIGASYAAIVVVLSAFFYNESLLPLQMAAIAALIAGVSLVSFKASELRSPEKLEKGVFFGLSAMLFWGISIFLFKPLANAFDPFAFGALMYAFMALIAAGLLLLPGKKAQLPPKNLWPTLAAVGALQTLGFLAFTTGISGEMLSIVTPIAAASPAVSAFLAKAINKETLEANQLLGILLAIAALVMISA